MIKRTFVVKGSSVGLGSLDDQHYELVSYGKDYHSEETPYRFGFVLKSDYFRWGRFFGPYDSIKAADEAARKMLTTHLENRVKAIDERMEKERICA